MDPTNSVYQFYGEACGWKMFDSTLLTPDIRHFLRAEAQGIGVLIRERASYRHLVEVGCGYGRYQAWAANLALGYEGIDLVPWMAQIGRVRIRETQLAHPGFVARAHAASVSDLRHLLASSKISPRACVVIFPFNCFGNLQDPGDSIRALRTLGADFVVSGYSPSRNATRIRLEYYQNCAFRDLAVTEDAKGTLITSGEGLHSYAYHRGYYLRLAATEAYRISAARSLLGIGELLHFESPPFPHGERLGASRQNLGQG